MRGNATLARRSNRKRLGNATPGTPATACHCQKPFAFRRSCTVITFSQLSSVCSSCNTQICRDIRGYTATTPPDDALYHHIHRCPSNLRPTTAPSRALLLQFISEVHIAIIAPPFSISLFLLSHSPRFGTLDWLSLEEGHLTHKTSCVIWKTSGHWKCDDFGELTYFVRVHSLSLKLDPN